MTHDELLYWLKETDKDKLEVLFSKADEVRKKHVGDDVHLRALVEISNHCSRQCHYCGLRAGNKDVKRYSMSKEEILACANKAASMGYGTIVMQAGEDFGLDVEWLAEVIKEIKQKTPMAVTLSLGERTKDELVLWKNAGADRYLMRFETSNAKLFKKLHPPISENAPDRIQILKTLKQIGYEVGSGVMTGIPNQSWDSLARDIELFKELNLDMIGSGPYIAHPDTPLGDDENCHC
ncbi:MAG: radical SAM protein, partial [Alphaproteobacteria bacterium]|nr:radical SAM protein [Alphaproteobacteria bacterium]